MNNGNTHNDQINKLGELIKGIKVAMLTTLDEDGTLRSRPMITQEAEFDGDLWFFTRDDAPKVHEGLRECQVNVSYSGDNRWVSVSGRMYLIQDRMKMQDLWNEAFRAWFPDGLDDPHLGLIKVEADYAEYWDSGPSNVLIQLKGYVKAALTGERATGGENKKLNLG
jgi:general stress protein 26